MSILHKIGILSTDAAALEKKVGDTLTVTITMVNPEPVHLIGFTLRAPEALELQNDSKWGDGLPIPDDEDIKETGPDVYYCEWSLKPDAPGLPPGTYTVAVVKFRCSAPIDAQILVQDFIAATYANGAPSQYECDVEQAPSLRVVAAEVTGRVAVKVVVE